LVKSATSTLKLRSSPRIAIPIIMPPAAIPERTDRLKNDSTPCKPKSMKNELPVESAPVSYLLYRVNSLSAYSPRPKAASQPPTDTIMPTVRYL